ncbi:MAG: YggS family pyridoxal phosphate-dependent enzyme, partial [Lachnospiraceae bacterium]|nr:YggS family pyridoxal phosphate-dependent enzyme [Lachnospiraceae bacterium]
MSVTDNYLEVKRRIREACKRAGRDESEVLLLPVSKTKPIAMIEELMAAGQKVFGENYVQELKEKKEALPGADFHMIGHLQRNKVRFTVGNAVMIHSVDSLRLAEEISKESVKRGVVTDVLIEINGGNEESKFGYDFSEAEDAVRAMSTLPGIRVKGLMCVAPFVEDPEENRPVFRKIFQVAVDIAAKNIDNIEMNVLSMGMTGDFET